MRHAAGVVVAALAALALAGPAASSDGPLIQDAKTRAEGRARAIADRPPVRGMVLGIYSDDDGDSYVQALEEIAALGADHVLIIVQEVMKDVRSTEVGPRSWLTPSPERLDHALATARELGLGIVLMPSLFLEETRDGEWRGAIEPKSWRAWWKSYEAFILKNAELAAKHRVEIFSVGSELCSTEDQRANWARLIQRARAMTPSLMTYSFNWDHTSQGRITDLIDVIGMNAYHDLAESAGTPKAELVHSWRRLQETLLPWQRSQQRRILFTEVGYRSVVRPEKDAWNYLEVQDYDGRAQQRCYEAFLEAWQSRREVAGIFFYQWRGEGGEGDTGYTPRGKPAAESLRRAWGGADADPLLELLPAVTPAPTPTTPGTRPGS
ncbi:MAG: hypothetical protein AAF533_16055 [Acidobacteriota bacterium]